MELKQNLAYVASTLPISVLNEKINEWRVRKILVASQHLEISYRYLITKHNDIELVVVPKQYPLQILSLFYHLLSARINSRKIYFFHECSCLCFDILVSLINPKGVFCPIVQLNAFRKLNFNDVRCSVKKLMLRLSGLSRVFVPYLRDGDGGDREEILWARLSYPRSIKIISINTSAHIRKATLKFENNINILFILGRDVVTDENLKRLYANIIDSLGEINVVFYGKDHPNPEFRLNLSHSKLVAIDPYCPIELVEDNFDFVLGTASTALLNYQNRAFSVIQLLKSDNPEAVDRRIQHFRCMPGGENIHVPQNFEELINNLKQIKGL